MQLIMILRLFCFLYIDNNLENLCFPPDPWSIDSCNIFDEALVLYISRVKGPNLMLFKKKKM